jgi:hypothetical protein
MEVSLPYTYRLLRIPLPAPTRRVSRLDVHLRTLAVEPDEPFEVGVFGALQEQLFTPSGGHHWSWQVRVEANEYEAVTPGQIAELLYLLLREVGLVGNPDRPML